MIEKITLKEPLWSRQKSESEKAYGYFIAYRDMGIERTLEKVANQYSKSVGLMNKFSQKNRWTERVAEWEAELDRQAAKEHIKDIAKMRAKQRKMASTMQLKGLKLLDAIEAGEAKLSEVVSLLKLGMEQERITMGDVGEVVEERAGETVASAVQIYIPDNGRDNNDGEN